MGHGCFWRGIYRRTTTASLFTGKGAQGEGTAAGNLGNVRWPRCVINERVVFHVLAQINAGGKNLSRTEVEGVPRSSGCYEMLFNLSRALALVTRRQSRKVNETQWNRSCLIEITSCNYYVL